MNKLVPLIKREVLEHKTLIVYLPLVMVAVCTAGIILSLFNLQRWGLESIWLRDSLVYEVEPGVASVMVEITGIEGVAALPFETRQVLFTQALSALAMPFQAVLICFMVFYFTLSLYQDRKDRSLLFWKSMPVSDRDTVVSKLLTGMVIAPAFYLVCAMVMQLLLMVIASIYALGFDVNITADIWQPAGLLTIWCVSLLLLPLSVVWLLPIYSWVMLVSAKVKSIPFAWVIGVPVTLVLLEKLLLNDDMRDATYTGSYLANHMAAVELISPVYNYSPWDAMDKFWGWIFSPLDLVASLILSAVFIAGAVYFRGKAGEL